MVKYVKNEEKVLTMVSWNSRHKFCNKFHYVELKKCFQATKLCMSFEHGPIITVQREPILSMHRIYMPVVRKMSFTFYFHTKFLENVLFVLQIEFFIESANIVRPFYCSILNCVCVFFNLLQMIMLIEDCNNCFSHSCWSMIISLSFSHWHQWIRL